MQALGIRLGGLREDDRETALAEMAGDVRRADGGADPLACGNEVGTSPLLQVEDEEPESPVVTPCPRDLPPQALLEMAPVVEAREAVGVREPARLGEEPRILECRPEDPRELFELLELGVGECPLDAAPEDRQRANPLLALAEERNGQAPAQAELVVRRLFGRVEVAELDRPRPASIRREADELARGLVCRESEGRCDRLAVVLAEDDQRRVGGAELAHGFEGPPQGCVEVERAPELAEKSDAPAFLLRVCERRTDLSDEALGPRSRFLHRGDLACGSVPPAPEEEDPEREEEHGQAERARARPGCAFICESHPGSPRFRRKKASFSRTIERILRITTRRYLRRMFTFE